MTDLTFVPKSARADAASIVLTNGGGNILRLIMPDADGATICAAQLHLELTRRLPRRP